MWELEKNTVDEKYTDKVVTQEKLKEVFSNVEEYLDREYLYMDSAVYQWYVQCLEKLSGELWVELVKRH